MEGLQNLWTILLGLGVEPRNLTFLQCSIRGVIVIVAGVAMVRLGSKRALAEKTAVDTLTIVIVASVLSRSINGPSPLFASIGAGFVLVLFHRALMSAACRWHTVGNLIKGTSDVIIRDGQPLQKAMNANQVSQHDLEEDLRLNASTEDASTIKIARVERSGDISFIKKDDA
jgi:uncharacterized membrane protein YcaP (DUF421 family)